MKSFKFLPMCLVLLMTFLVACEKDHPVVPTEITGLEKKGNPPQVVEILEGADKLCSNILFSATEIDIVVSPPYEAGVFGVHYMVRTPCPDLQLELVDGDGNLLLNAAGDPLLIETITEDVMNDIFFYSDDCIDVYAVVRNEDQTVSSAVVGPVYLGYSNEMYCGLEPSDGPDFDPEPPSCDESGCFDLFSTEDITNTPYGSPTVLISVNSPDDNCLNAPGVNYAWKFTHSNGVQQVSANANFSLFQASYTLTACGTWTANLIDASNGVIFATFCFTVGNGSLNC